MNKKRVLSTLNSVSPHLYHSLVRRVKLTEHKKADNAIRDPLYLDPPQHLTIFPTIKCNLRCGMCWWWGENGIAFKYTSSKEDIIYNELTFKEISSLLEQARIWKSSVGFIGGEIFVRKDMIDLLAFAQNLGIRTGIVTNGTLINQRIAEALSQMDNLEITISIDGTKEIHNKIRGIGAYEKSIQAINKIGKYKQKNKGPSILINTTITPDIVGHLEEMIDDLSSNPYLDLIKIQHLWFTNRSRAELHKQVLNEEFGIKNDPGVNAHIIDGYAFTPEQLDSLGLEIQRLERKKSRVQFRFYPPLIKANIMKYYTDLDYSLRKSCDVAFTDLLIQPDGTVKFCPDEWIANFNIGNIRTSSLETIWKNNLARHFREVLLKRKLFPSCNRCCHINI